MRYRALIIGTFVVWVAGSAHAAFTNNIMLTGYWPPTNNMLRHFSTNPEQNPDGWEGQNWESRGYDIHSYFPEFPYGLGKGEGDFEVDYQDTSEDFWRVVADIHPVAIISFGRGSPGRNWEVEWRARNLAQWIDDYEAPRQPTPAPPEPNMPVDHIRYSSLPMQEIVDAVNAAYAEITLDAYIDETGFAGEFLCEYIAYHTMWYHELHADQNDPYWNVSAGFIHVGSDVYRRAGRIATEISLRELITYVDSQVPEPGSAVLLALLAVVASSVHAARRAS